MRQRSLLLTASLSALIALTLFVRRPTKAPPQKTSPTPSYLPHPSPSSLPSPSEIPSNPTPLPASIQPPIASPIAVPTPINNQRPVFPTYSIPLPTPQPLADSPLLPLVAVSNGLRDFRTAFGENPVGSNSEISAILAGKNSGGFDFLKSQKVRQNSEGELVDTWGTPLFLHQISGSQMEIISAGQDRTLGTADDVLLR
jgi:hypothetical protein